VANSTDLSGLSALVTQSIDILRNAGNTYDPSIATPGATGVRATATESIKGTANCAIIGFLPIATPTDIWQIFGSGTKTVRVTRLTISGTATAASSVDIQVIKRSTANSAGTATTPTIAINDSNDAAATAVVKYYAAGANPTLGTTVANVRSQRLNLGAAGSAGFIEWTFTTRNTKGLVLRGVAEGLCINWNGAAVPAGTNLCIDVEWTEE
jgi:hypothetical protein